MKRLGQKPNRNKNICLIAGGKIMYEDFGKLKDTMAASGYDLNKDYIGPLDNIKRRNSGAEFSLTEHVRGMIYALLSNERGWAGIEKKLGTIDAIFFLYDPQKIKSGDHEAFESQIREIRAGNRQIKKQMQALKYDIEMLERIADENGSIDAYFNSTEKYKLVKSLAEGKYKLQRMGVPLVSEYLKNMGVDIVKPDRHVNRLIGYLGYSKHAPARYNETFAACEGIAKEYGISNIEVDAVLWQFCAEGRFNKCGENPHCAGCLVKNCKGRKQ